MHRNHKSGEIHKTIKHIILNEVISLDFLWETVLIYTNLYNMGFILGFTLHISNFIFHLKIRLIKYAIFQIMHFIIRFFCVFFSQEILFQLFSSF